MEKVSEYRFFKELFMNALLPRRHVKDSILDFGTLRNLKKQKKNTVLKFSTEIWVHGLLTINGKGSG